MIFNPHRFSTNGENGVIFLFVLLVGSIGGT